MIKKIKKHGIKGSIKIALTHLYKKINDGFYYICWIFPVKGNVIAFESESDLSDNAHALYSYMMLNDYFKKCKAVWLVDDIKKENENHFVNTIFVEKMPKKISLKRSYYLATCKWYIYDHNNVLSNLHKRKECKIINLWHGCGFKGEKGTIAKCISKPDYTIVTSQFFAKIQSELFGFPRETFLDFGYPRNDCFFNKNLETKKIIENKWQIGNKKVFLWMPTFRRSYNEALNEEYFQSTTGLPLIDTLKKLEQFNEYLKKHNTVCLFKLHHLQAELGVFKDKYSNIRVIKDEEIKEMGLQLYDILPITDFLISDYSSVTTDYMLLNKPIIYTLDDYDDYKNSRGFVISDPAKYFAGYHVKNTEELENALNEVIAGKDKFSSERKNVISEMHSHIDGNASKRISKFLDVI